METSSTSFERKFDSWKQDKSPASDNPSSKISVFQASKKGHFGNVGKFFFTPDFQYIGVEKKFKAFVECESCTIVFVW